MPEESAASGESASSGDGTPIRPEIGSTTDHQAILRTPEITPGTRGDVSRVTGDGMSSRAAHMKPPCHAMAGVMIQSPHERQYTLHFPHC